MDDNNAYSRISLVLFSSAAFIIVIAGLKAASAIVIPLLLAIFLAVVSTPPLFWLQNKGVPNSLALCLVIVTIISIGLLSVAVVGSSMQEFSDALPTYEALLREKLKALLSWAQNLGITLQPDQFSRFFDPAAALSVTGRLLNGLGDILTNAFLVSVAVLFILIEASTFPAKLKSILHDPETSLQHFSAFIGNVKQYIVIKTIMSLITAACISLCLVLLRVDFPILWGWFAFFLNFVPYIGSLIAAFPAVALALLLLGPSTAMWTVLAYLLVNIVVGNIVEPRFLGRGLGLSTIVVFVSLIFWGWVFGPVGMFLSIPLTMLVKIAVEADERTRWIGVLLSAHAPTIDAELSQDATLPGS